MFSEKGFERERGDFGKMSARVGWGDSGVGAFAVLSAGVNTPHPLNAIKGKKIAFEAGDLAALLHPCQRTPTTNGKRATLASGGRPFGNGSGRPYPPRRPFPFPLSLDLSTLSPLLRCRPLDPCTPPTRRTFRARPPPTTDPRTLSKL